ncbi:MAG: hypothetical protein ACTSRA_21780, partial [Promethearchaeota archaeon]
MDVPRGECVVFQVFDLVNPDLNPDDKIEAIDEFVKSRSSHETFYYPNLFLVFSDITLKTKNGERVSLKEIADDLPGAVGSVPPKIAPFLKPDVIMSLLPEQLRSLTPQQLRSLLPEQLQFLAP